MLSCESRSAIFNPIKGQTLILSTQPKAAGSSGSNGRMRDCLGELRPVSPVVSCHVRGERGVWSHQNKLHSCSFPSKRPRLNGFSSCINIWIMCITNVTEQTCWPYLDILILKTRAFLFKDEEVRNRKGCLGQLQRRKQLGHPYPGTRAIYPESSALTRRKGKEALAAKRNNGVKLGHHEKQI